MSKEQTTANITAHISRQWDVMSVSNGVSGRGDIAARELRTALAHGWEPFAVTDSRIWLRKLLNG